MSSLASGFLSHFNIMSFSALLDLIMGLTDISGLYGITTDLLIHKDNKASVDGLKIGYDH